MSALDDAKRAWAGEYDGLSAEDATRRARGFAAMVRAIAEHGVVTPQRFAERTGLGLSAAS